MNYSTQPLMRSQFILVYGPGSIIETENGPRLIPSLKVGLGNFKEFSKKYEIFDVRMEQLVNNIRGNDEDNDEIRFFTLPSNASTNSPDNVGLYKTAIFPIWKICYNSKDHKSNTAILFNSQKFNNKCPCCGNSSNSHVRFVCACPDGHLDEVPWDYAIHGHYDCNKDYFIWDAKGNSLASITLKCPDSKCNAEKTMEYIYKKRYHCYSRLPELTGIKNNKNVGFANFKRGNLCGKNKMKVVQRQSTSLRIPLTKTLLTLPNHDTDSLRIFQRQDQTSKNILLDIYDKVVQDLEESTHNWGDEKYDCLISQYLNDLGKYLNDEKIKNILIDDPFSFKIAVMLYRGNGEYNDLLDEEFQVLADLNQENSDNFNKGEPYNYDIYFDDFCLNFDIFPINKIRTITTQLGYQRRPYFDNVDEDIDNQFTTRFIGQKANFGDNKIWYPAFEGIGEGIFIKCNSNPLNNPNIKNVISDWKNVDNNLFSDVYDGIDKPLLVWWHSLSHAIIRELGYMSGYSSSSIRERIYANNGTNGGILLYNTSVGDDCGMGGLIDSVKNFDMIMKNALNNIYNCSNDPLCNEIVQTGKTINGAACINCLFLSETSCEWGNRFLDRHMLIGE